MTELVDAAERDLVATTLRRLAGQHDGPQLLAALDDFGFADVLAVQPHAAVSSLFDALGRSCGTSAAIHDVLMQPLIGLLPASGASYCVLLPAISEPLAGRVQSRTGTLSGLVLDYRADAGLLAPVLLDREIAWAHVHNSAHFPVRPINGLDPSLQLKQVSAEGVPVTVLVAGSEAAALWNAVATAGRRALAYQISGAVGQMIDLAVAHARDRTQFGRPIGAFQAVRNRLADAYVAHEAAAAALESGWTADDEFLAAMLAKSLAGRAARIAGTHCQQVLAGVGFTAEHPFHRFLARALVLDSLLGSAAELRRTIGAYVAALGTIPRLVEL
jgi:hypothetical protein